MSFITHLQSSLILGTKMTHPDEEHFYTKKCNQVFKFIQDKRTDKLEELIKLEIDVDKCEYKHLHPLSFAIKQKNYDAVRVLLTYGANLYYKDIFSKSALDYALEINHEKIIHILLYHGATCSSMPQNNIQYATNMKEAVYTMDLKSLVYLNDLGENIFQSSANKTTLLHLSIEAGYINTLVYLLNKGINIDIADKSGTSALILSAMYPRTLNILKLLVKRNATLDQKSSRQISALTMAIKRENIEAAIFLVKNGANVNIRDNRDTPLSLTHKAIEDTNNIELKQKLRELETLLLAKYAHVNNSDDNLLWSPIMQTASHYQDKTNIAHLKSLIKLGANLDQIDKNNRTALMIASSLGRIEAMEILLKYNAKLNRVDKFGWTSLMLSVYYNQKEAVKLLLYNGADVNFVSQKGLSALKVAVDNDRVALVSLLKDFGAVSPSE